MELGWGTRIWEQPAQAWRSWGCPAERQGVGVPAGAASAGLCGRPVTTGVSPGQDPSGSHVLLKGTAVAAWPALCRLLLSCPRNPGSLQLRPGGTRDRISPFYWALPASSRLRARGLCSGRHPRSPQPGPGLHGSTACLGGVPPQPHPSAEPAVDFSFEAHTVYSVPHPTFSTQCYDHEMRPRRGAQQCPPSCPHAGGGCWE